MMTDEEYEAELQARTPEEWAAMKEKALADERDIHAMKHLVWRRDVRDWEHTAKLAAKPGTTREDLDYFFCQVGEIADTLRAARDNPDERERERWHRLMFCAAVIGSSEENCEKLWLEQARDLFGAMRGPDPGDDAALIAQATYAIECLLDALLMKPANRAELKGKMDSVFMQWAGENGIRGGTYNANGQFEMFGQIIPFNPGKDAPEGRSPPV